MNAQTPIDAAVEERSIVLQVEATPSLVLLDPAKFETFYEEVRRQSEADAGTDVSTEEGRSAIRSAAFKIARTKTAIDDARKKLTEDWRKQTKEVNDLGGVITDKLQALQDTIRQPLTDFENAEKAREASCKTIEAKLDAAGVVLAADTSETVAERLAEVRALVVDEKTFRERFDAAIELQLRTIAHLETTFGQLQQAEADRAELDRLRQAEEERQAQSAKQAEDAQALVSEAELRAQAAEARAAAAEALRVAEQEKAAALERQRQEATAQAAARAADAEHKAPIMRTAKEALMEHAGLSETAAKRVVLSIAGGLIPAVTINF